MRMNILFLLAISFAFYWLMVETKWLTIRIERTPILESKTTKGVIDISGILCMAIAMGYMVYLAIGCGLYRSQTYTEKEHEEAMSKLWKHYGRNQPKRISAI